MPYSSNISLPDYVRRLSQKKQSQWRAIFNQVYADTDGSTADKEKAAFKAANGVVFGKEDVMKDNELCEGKRIALNELRYSKFEVVSDDGGPAKITGVISIVDAINQNGRVYPKAVMESAIEKISENLNRHPGLVDHPEGMASIEDIGIRWTNIYLDGDKVMGEGDIVPTRKGQDLENVIRAGIEVGVSTRGYGSAKRGKWGEEDCVIVQPDFELESADAVVDPSVMDARITQIESEEEIPWEILTADSLTEHRPDLVEEIEDLLCAVWSTAQVNDLPDSSFAYVEPGKKDSSGRTVPRSKRHFPFKDADGKIDPAHVRNALARLSQSKLPQDAKDKVLAVLKKAAKAVGIEVSDAKDSSDNDITEVEMNKDENAEEAVVAAPVEEASDAPKADETTEVVVTESPELTEAKASLEEANAKVEQLTARLSEVESEKTALAEDVANMEKILSLCAKEIGELAKKKEFQGAGMMSMMGSMMTNMMKDMGDGNMQNSMDALVTSVNSVVESVTENAKDMQAIMDLMSKVMSDMNKAGDSKSAGMVAEMRDKIKGMTKNMGDGAEQKSMDALIASVDSVLESLERANIRDYVSEKCRPEKFGWALIDALRDCKTTDEVDGQFDAAKARVEAELAGQVRPASKGVVHEEEPRSPRPESVEKATNLILGK